MTFSQANTYSGGTSIGGGTFIVTNTTGSGTGSGVVNVNSSAILCGTGSVSGATTIHSGGTLNAGTVGTVGTLTLTGGATFNSGANFGVDISGSTKDLLSVTGTAALAGNLNVTVGGTLSSSYTILTATNVTGGFTNLNAGNRVITTDKTRTFHVTQSGTSIVLDSFLTPATIGTITATPTNARVFTGGLTTFTFTIHNSATGGGDSLNFTAASGTNVSGTVSGTTTLAAASTSGSISGFTFNSGILGTGNQTGNFTITDPNAANSPQTGTVTIDVVANRVFTQTATIPVALGRIIGGQTSGSGIGNFTTTGTNATTVNVTVGGGTITLGGITVSGGGVNQVFNGPDALAHTGSLTLSGLVAGGSGTQSGTVTLTGGNGLTGEGLTGESDSLALAYSYDTVANRVFTQTATNPVAFGRIISGQTSGSGIGNFTTTGTNDTTVNVQVNSGTYTLGGVTVSNASNQIFNGPDALAHTGSLTLSGLTAAGSGTQFGTITLTNGNGKLTGEGLTGESDALALAYSYDTVANRVFTQTAINPADLGRVINGQTGSGTANFSTTGTHDSTVDVTVNSGSTVLGGVTVNSGSNQIFNGPDGSAHTGSVGLSLTAGGSGVQSGTVTLTSGNGALSGESLTGESDALALAYTYDTVTSRVITAASVNFGRVLFGTTASTQSSGLTTTGSHATTADLTVNNGASGTDGNITAASSSAQLFNSASSTGSLSVTNGTAFGSAGTQGGTVTLTAGTGNFTGELTGQTLGPITVAYSIDPVTSRVITAAGVNFGRVLVGTTASAQSSGLSTSGSHDTTADLTVKNSASGTDGNITATSGSSQLFNSAASTGSLSVTNSSAFGSAGTQNGTVTLAAGTGNFTGEVTGQTLGPVTVGYAIDPVNERTYTSPTTVNLGNLLLNANDVVSSNQTIITSGLHDVTADATLSTSTSGTINGLSLTGGTDFINGTNATDNITRTLTGTLATNSYGSANGTFFMNSTDEFSNIVTQAASVAYTANVGYATTANSDRGGLNTADRLAFQMTSTETGSQTFVQRAGPYRTCGQQWQLCEPGLQDPLHAGWQQ